MNRGSGIILAVSSLPSKYGIGTFGRAAYRFADFLHDAKQSYWQMLPLGPVSYGNSPYQSPSSFAGNPYYIDLELLEEDGLLKKGEADSFEWGSNPRYADYGKLYENRIKVLSLAKERGYVRDLQAVEAFKQENPWVDDYALFMACKKSFGMKGLLEWPDEALRRRETVVLEKYKKELKDDIELYTYIQFLFFKQWDELKKYIHSKDIKIIGDIPIYVAADSADIWTEPENFQLDENLMPKSIAGVPPDAFSKTGQLWGNPLYDWEYMKKDGFGWWIRRIAGCGRLYDVIRFDHFRGLDEYWSVPKDEATAENGSWKKGPGEDFVNVLNNWFPELKFIAEDLGVSSQSLTELMKKSSWPGMKVLEFAFDSENSEYQPHNYEKNCICYTGTHDNAPLNQWFDEIHDEYIKSCNNKQKQKSEISENAAKESVALPQKTSESSLNCIEKEQTENDKFTNAVKYFNLTEEEGYNIGMIRGGMSSVAQLFMAQMQDWLGLGEGHRMNEPSKSGGCWEWRLLEDEISGEKGKLLAEKISEMTMRYGRHIENH